MGLPEAEDPMGPPLAGGMPSRKWVPVAIATALAVWLGGTLWFASRAPTSAGPVEPPPASAPAPPGPSPTPEPPPPAPDVVVTVTSVAVEPTDDAALFGGVPAPPDARAVDEAVEAARAAVARYLTGMFVEPATRFTRQPLTGLLDARALAALSPPDVRALGALRLRAASTRAGPVDAVATVVAGAGGVDVVALSYDALVEVRFEDGDTEQLTQHAELAFVLEGSDWRAGAVDARLQGPEPPGGRP